MDDSARAHIITREITRTSNVLRRRGYIHHEKAIWHRDPGHFYEVFPGAMCLEEIELGRRVSHAQIAQLVSLRTKGTPFSDIRVS